jgi:hypothetical protein
LVGGSLTEPGKNQEGFDTENRRNRQQYYLPDLPADRNFGERQIIELHILGNIFRIRISVQVNDGLNSRYEWIGSAVLVQYDLEFAAFRDETPAYIDRIDVTENAPEASHIQGRIWEGAAIDSRIFLVLKY